MIFWNFDILLFFVLLSLSLKEFSAEKVYRLKELNVDEDWITLSGFSAGGTFAQQVQISHSKMFRGVGVFSHTYYRCGRPNGLIDDYDSVCTKIGLNSSVKPYDVNMALADIESYNRKGLIDDPNNLRDTRLYVYAGTKNSLFTTDQSLKILEIYSKYLRSPPHQISTRVQSAELVMPTKDFGGPCDEPADNTFFLANCGFSGAFEALNFLHGGILRRPRWNVRLQPIDSFNQTEFSANIKGRTDMDTMGYIYVPTGCRYPNSYCLLHLYFHGCLTGREFNGTDHILRSGYLEVAEENHIIMIFPQALSSPENEIGCFDTFGVTGELYATQKGAQVMVVKAILDRVLPKRSAAQYLHSSAPHLHPLHHSTAKGHRQVTKTASSVTNPGGYHSPSVQASSETHAKRAIDLPKAEALVGHTPPPMLIPLAGAEAADSEGDSTAEASVEMPVSLRMARGHNFPSRSARAHHEDSFMPSRGPFYSNAYSIVTEAPTMTKSTQYYSFPWDTHSSSYTF